MHCLFGLCQYWAYNLNILTSVTLPKNLKVIGNRAFYCCFSLTSVTIPNSVTSIDEDAFYDCSSLTSVTIPNSVTQVGGSAFSGCSALKDVTFEDGDQVLSLSGYSDLFRFAPLETLYLGRNLSYYSSYAPFKDKKTLKSVTIGNSVTQIGESAFSGCSALKKVNISSLETWCNIDFNFHSSNPLFYAHNLYLNGKLVTNLVIPESVTQIKKYTFDGCSLLTSVTIPNSVTEIGSSAFNWCSALKEVNISSLEAWCNIDFNYSSNPLSHAHNLYLNGELLTDLIIPESVTQVKDYTFDDCSSLTSVTIPNSVTEIGDYAFNGCSGLTEITLSGSVRKINSNAFSGCSSLTAVNVINPIPPVIESTTFTNTEDATLNVPVDSRNIYWIHPYWGKFNTITGWNCGSDVEITADNVVYHVTSEENATVEISAANITSRSGNDFVIPQTITYNNKEYTVAGIANGGLKGVGISSITLPATISYIGLDAFKGCSDIAAVTCLAVLPPSIDSSSFEDAIYGSATLEVPETAADSYKAHAVWSKFNIKSVDPSPTSLSFATTQWNGYEGETFTITTTILPESVSNKTLTWSSSAPGIATVDANGLVTAIKPGKATITATTANGLTATCEVTVNAKPSSIEGIESEDAQVRVEGGNIIAPEGSEVFDLSGRRVAAKGLRPGIYIVLAPNNKTVKVRVE